MRRVENKSRTITCIAQPSRANVDQLDTGSIEHVNGEQSRASSRFVRCWREALHFDHSPASLPKSPLKRAVSLVEPAKTHAFAMTVKRMIADVTFKDQQHAGRLNVDQTMSHIN